MLKRRSYVENSFQHSNARQIPMDSMESDYGRENVEKLKTTWGRVNNAQPASTFQQLSAQEIKPP